MKFSFPLLISASAITVSADAWSMGGGPRLFLGPNPAAQMLLDLNAQTMMRQRQRTRDYFNAITRVSPRYEIKDSEKEIQISLDVPGIKAEDIHVTIEEGDSVLSIQGQRESTDGTSTTTRRFSQSFSLDPTVDLDKFTAHLNNGVLVITAPKDLQRIEKNLRRIPITTGPTSSEEIAIGSSTHQISDVPNQNTDVQMDVITTPQEDTIDLDITPPSTEEGASKA